MTVTLTDLSQLTQQQIDAALATTLQLIQATYPTVDTKRGPLHDLLLLPQSALAAANQENIALALRSMSLAAAAADPAATDTATLTDLVSNYRITPLPATAATGQVALIAAALIQITVPAGFIFVDSAGNAFAVSNTYTARTSAGQVTSATDVLMLATGSGTYTFSVPAAAVTPGVAANIPHLTTLTMPSGLPNITSAHTATDFSGGSDAESNAELLNRASTSWTVASTASRASIDGLVRTVPGYEHGFVSVVGYGDAEQIRYHSILPVAFGGRTDVYVAPGGLYQTVQINKTATLIGSTGGHGIWQINLGRDDIPGLYKISSVTLPNNVGGSSFTISSETRGFDISAGTAPRYTLLPDLATVTEAAYSPYQTDIVQFIDTTTSLTGLTIGVSTATYAISASVLPSLAAIQDAVTTRTLRSTQGDCLVRAAVPCFVTATVTVSYSSTGVVPSVGDIQTAVAAAVNNAGFVAPLQAATLQTAAAAVLPVNSWVTSVTMAGSVYRPNGTTLSLSGTVLDPGSDPLNLVTYRTVSFFLRPADVTVVLNSVAVPSI